MKIPFKTDWWFGTFFIFPYIGKIIPTDQYFKGVETTNQNFLGIYGCTYFWKSALYGPNSSVSMGHRAPDDLLNEWEDLGSAMGEPNKEPCPL